MLTSIRPVVLRSPDGKVRTMRSLTEHRATYRVTGLDGRTVLRCSKNDNIKSSKVAKADANNGIRELRSSERFVISTREIIWVMVSPRNRIY